VYLTSLGDEWHGAYKNTLEFIKKSGALLAFSPGTLQLLEGYAGLEEGLKLAHILFLNKEEGEKIIESIKGIKGGNNEMKTLLIELQKLGPKIVVITDGKNGSYVLDEEKKMYFIGIFNSEIVERTGAGDAYATGFLSAIINGQTVSEAMRWGTFESASVVSAVGAQKGLLTKEQMEKILNEHKQLQAKEM
jgi:sugar/nucleoside kinase (ribokinase family)